VANVKVNGVTATLTGENWTLANVALVVGANTITVTSADNAGNLATQTVTVTRELPPDTNPPVITINSPQNQSSTYEGQITVTGTAVDLGINASGVQHVFVNGIEAASQANGNWSASVSLNIGNNPITVTATDAAAPTNQGTAQIQVTRLENPSPTLTITSPSNNLTTTSETISVSGTAAANGSTTNLIAQITVNGQNAIFDVNTNTWTLSNVAIAIGINTITAQATDSSGKQTTSQITITRNPINQPPTVNAGIDQSINLPNYANLNGLVNDDGLPNNPPTSIWSKISGGGTVIFSNVNNLQTNASFSTSGIYILRLTSFDGEFSASDDIAITVNPGVQAPIPNNYRQFSDSPWYNFSGSWFYLEDFEDHALNTPGVTALSGGVVSVIFGPTFHDSVDGDDGILDGLGRNGDDFYEPYNLGVKFAFNQQILGHYPTHVGLVFTDGYQNNQGRTFFETFDASGNSLGVKGPFSFPFTTHNGEAINDFFLGFYHQAGISAVRVWNNQNGIEIDHLQYGYREPSGNNVAPSVNIGADQTINLPNAANLLATVTDDGLPIPANLTFIWSKISGAGNVTFSDISSPQTTAQFSNVGEYILRLSVFDGEFATTDDLIILVNPINQPPTVNAGIDQSILIPNSATLSGNASDDGYPSGSALQTTWTKTSGNGNVTFSNQNSVSTTASFSQAGIYVLRLTATDSQLNAFDEITITVNQVNQAPIVNAGQDKTLGLPNNPFQFIQNDVARFNILASNPTILVDFDNIASDTNITGNTYNGILFENGNQPSPSSPLIVVKGSETFTPIGFGGVTNIATNKLLATSGENVLSPGGKELAPANPLKENDDIKLTFDEPVAAVGFDILFQSYDFYGAVKVIIYDPQGVVLYQNNNLPVSSPAGGGAAGGKEFYGFISKRSNIKSIIIDEFDGDSTFPDANIGIDSIRIQKILPLSTSVILDGTISDDGLPSNILTSFWSKISGPGTPTFLNGISPTTSVTFSTAGTYVLRLTASDGVLSSSDDVTVVAVNSNQGINDPPIVNLGADRTITFPTNFVGIVSSVTDDGLPTGSTLTYLWSKVSGSGNVVFNAPTSFQTNATFVTAGVYVLRLTASDGQYSSSDDITVTVKPANSAPFVNAGNDQTISLPNNVATLSGTATDDGLPTGSTLQKTWTKTSGSGSVTFANQNSVTTTVTFSQVGSYVLRLTATDGLLTVFDEVAITVNAQVLNLPPTANAGADQAVKFKANFANNPSAEAGLVNGIVPNWTSAQGLEWTRVLGEEANVPPARFGDYLLKANDSAIAETYQDIDIQGFAGGIDNGTQQFTWQAYVHSSAKTNPDTARVIVEYRNTSQNLIATLTSDDVVSTDNWHLTEDTRVPPVGTRFMRIRLIAIRNSGTTNDVFFDGLSLKAVGDVAAVKLSGTATDDGLPVGNPFTKIWTKVSGNGNVLFAANEAISGSTYDAPGTYTLRLTASDGVLSATDDVTVTINPANQAPTTNAGIDQTITFPSTAQLDGTASDDVGNLRYRWTKVYGSGGGTGLGVVTFSNARLLNPTASFTLPGTYVLRLTTEDGELETTDDVTVTVNPGATNLPPTVSPGSNQTIVLPINSVTLNGIVTDDGLPTNNLTINWAKTSGSGNVSFANSNSANTTATFDATGVYVLRLTAADGQFTVWYEVLVTVLPVGGQGGINLPPTVNVGADQNITLSQTGIVEAQVSDDGLPFGGSFSANWTKISGAGNVAFSNPNNTSSYINFSQTGVYVLRLTVSDSALSAFDEVTVTVSNNQAPPVANILTPLDGANLTDKTAITGNVSGGNWKVEYASKSDDNSSNLVWTLLNQGSAAVSNSALANFDTTLLLNGLYAIKLTATDQFGQRTVDEISVVVERNLKVGQFTVSFEDMSVPVEGIPIQVIRTYDSRDKRKGDFGYGWTLGIKNLRVEKTQVLGLKWRQSALGGAFPTYCIENTKPHIVSVTMPDGKVEKFDARLQKMCQQYVPIRNGNLIFAAQAGTTGKLEVVGDNYITVAGSVPGPVDFVGFNGQGIFDSAQFKYTSKDGTEFILNQNGGLQSVKDLNNNTLTISPSGITHSSGKSIAFTRDGQGRISAITDPDGNVQSYNYDANGDLISFVDRENQTTGYGYYTNPAHHLKDITDSRGVTPIRNEYDVEGRLLKNTDANGNEIIYTHNLAARNETVTDRLGNSTTFIYDNRGNVLTKTDALGNITSFSYDVFDNVLTETNALGKTTTYTYDSNDNRTSTTDSLGNRNEFTYNILSSLVTAKDAKNNVTTNTYGFRNGLTSTTDALGNITSNTYNLNTGKLSLTTDALGNETRFEYSNSYLIKQTDAQGNETLFNYDNNGNQNFQRVTRTNALGQLETITTTSEFDNLNRLTKTTYADGTFTRTEYNTIGQQAATVDQAGNRTEFEYDSLGRQIKTTYADGKFEESTFDAEGRRLTSKDRSGKVTNYEYDVLGRLKKTTYSDGTFTTTNYDAIGQVTSSVDAKGNATTYQYDDVGRRKKVINSLSQATEFFYDANGSQTSMTDALNHSTNYIYDALNRRTRTNFADNTFVETTFDQLGRRVSEKDQAGKITQFFYDSLGRMTKVKDALNQETVYGYNELGQQISQKDALNRETKFEYDKLGRRTKRILPLGQVETYNYNNLGNLTTKTDFNGKATTFAYDNMRRLMSKTPDASLNEPSISFTYNDLGQRNSMTDASGTTNYVYDVRNRLASKQTPQGNLNYTYDENGSIKTLRSNHANGVSVDYNYDELSRLSSVKDNRLSGSQTTSYNYDAVGNLQSYTYPNTVTTSYAYNNLNRLTTLSVANGQTNLASYSYTLGASGNRTSVTENTGRTVNYAYDDLYRLTSETIANSANNGSISYSFDAVGNRLQRSSNVNLVANQSSSYDANDRLNSDVFDNNGSTKVSNGKNYNYDFENHLSSTSDGVTVVYDGDGNRVSKTANGITTKYLVDTNNLTGYAQVVEELQNNQVVKQYTYGLDLISQRQSLGVSFYNYDGHGSVRGLSNNLGNTTDTYTYDAFGTLIERTGTTDNNYLYAGEQFDADLSFYYNRARYLNVGTGRFISQDTYEGNNQDPISLHKYLYANADGVNKIDPSGNFSIAEAMVVVSIITVIATMSSCTFIRDNFNKPVRVQMRWDTAFRDFNSSNSLSSAEIQDVKSTAKTEFERAYRGFNVEIDETAERKIIINDDWGSGMGTSGGTENGSTAPAGFSATSFVYYNVLKFGINEINSKMGLNKSRSELVHGLGQGIGATAAHELGHQANLEYISHNVTQGYYDSKETTAEGGGDTHFFGQLKWTPEALEKMNRVLLRTK
jgi:RHS repeat-associated protein